MSRNAMGDLVCNAMKTAAPAVTNDVDFLAGMKWGLSFLINPEAMPTGRSAGSLAWAGWPTPTTGSIRRVVSPASMPHRCCRSSRAAVQAFEAFETAVYRALKAPQTTC